MLSAARTAFAAALSLSLVLAGHSGGQHHSRPAPPTVCTISSKDGNRLEHILRREAGAGAVGNEIRIQSLTRRFSKVLQRQSTC